MENLKMGENIKSLIIKNEYFQIFIISTVMGIVGQTILPWLSIKLNLYYFNFRFFISNIDIYPFIVILLINFKNTKHKKAFWRILIYFTGLCLGYYGYTSAIAVYNAFSSRNANYLLNILFDLKDSLEYIFVGVLAGLWGFFMLKYKYRKRLYGLLVLPFILINIYILYANFTCNPPQIFMIIVDILCLVGIIMCSFNHKLSE